MDTADCPPLCFGRSMDKGGDNGPQSQLREQIEALLFQVVVTGIKRDKAAKAPRKHPLAAGPHAFRPCLCDLILFLFLLLLHCLQLLLSLLLPTGCSSEVFHLLLGHLTRF